MSQYEEDPFENDYDPAPQHPVQKKNFPQKEGEITIPGPLTVDSATDKDGANYAIVKIKGYWDSFLCDKGKFTAGQKLNELVVIGKASGNEQYPYRYSLKKDRPAGGSFPGQGGGARSSWQPKSPEEFHAPSIGGIIKSCIESGADEAQAKAWIGIYLDACKSAGK